MPNIANLVHQSTLSGGTGDLTLTALNGRQSFNAGFGTGGTDVFFYFISHKTAGQWEIGTGHLSSATILVRDTVIASSNADALVDFSAGEKDVINDIPASYQQLLTTLAADLGEKQPLDGDLTALAALSGTGFLKRTGSETYALDTNAYLTGNQTVTLSGDVTGLGATAITATIANDAISNSKLANMTTATIKGRTTAGTGDPEDLTATQATALLNAFTSSLKGLTPASGGGTANFLRADGTWAAPAGGGGSSTKYDPDAQTGWQYSESDFVGGATPTVTVTTGSGTGATSGSSYSTAGAIMDIAGGVIRMSTGTTSSGKAGRSNISGAGNFSFKTGMEYFCGNRAYYSDLPDATDDFYTFVGYKQTSSADPRSNTSAGLYYDRNYTNWQFLRYYGGTAYYTDTGIPFAATTWFDLGVKVTGHDTYSSVLLEAFINGVSVVSANTVQNVTSLWSFNFEITKIAGTNTRHMYIDHEFIASRRTA